MADTLTVKLQYLYLPVFCHSEVQVAHCQHAAGLRVLKSSRGVFSTWWYKQKISINIKRLLLLLFFSFVLCVVVLSAYCLAWVFVAPCFCFVRHSTLQTLLFKGATIVIWQMFLTWQMHDHCGRFVLHPEDGERLDHRVTVERSVFAGRTARRDDRYQIITCEVFSVQKLK